MNNPPNRPEPPTKSDRRSEPRVDIAVPLHLKFANLDAVFAGNAVNISKGGMFIPMRSPPAVGTQFHIDLSIQEQLVLDAAVEVVRRVDGERESGVGVRFVQISFGAQSLIDRVLADENLFGDYRIEALLGQGGMAEVYRARDLTDSNAGRVVAIKRILPELASDAHIAKLFRKEGAVTRALRHPNIVEVYDAGEIKGTFHIVMEYIDGCSLGQLFTACAARQIHMPIAFACYLTQTVAEALAYAHRAVDGSGRPIGLVHRDVTPGNILISRHGHIKLTDFGVALVRGGRGEVRAGHVGKDMYASPEQLIGARVTGAADVYSLGAVLFEALTNSPPFPDSDAREWHTLPQRLSALRSEVPEHVATIVASALAPLPPRADSDETIEELAGRHGYDQRRCRDAEALAQALAGAYEPAVGNRLAIAAIVRDLFGPEQPRV